MRALLAATLALAAISTSVLGQAPDSLSFQGFVTDTGGAPINNAGVSMTFKLYEGSSEIWSETQPSVTIVGGVFNVLLGSVTPLDTVRFNRPLLLGIKVGADAEIVPRTLLAAAAYAKALPGLYTFYREDAGPNKSYNVVGGGPDNVIGDGVVGATIGGGGGLALNSSSPNQVLGDFGTVGGGISNTASGIGATVGGGDGNTASGPGATVGGGKSNTSGGYASFVAGQYARAFHDGVFVWQDSSGSSHALTSSAANQFLARASGGFFFYTDAAPDLNVGISLPGGSGTWTALSSKASKTNFNEVDGLSYLDRVASLDLKEWSYKTEHGVTHVGPMAEDFYAAFGHGPTDKGISGVDGDGVALAAIQGLYQLVKELQAENARMRAAMARAGME